jgi:hypothetical protein
MLIIVSSILHPIRNSRGAIFAETALVFPLMVFFLFSIIDFSLLLHTYSMSDSTLRELLRFSSTLPNMNRSDWRGNPEGDFPDQTYPEGSTDTSYDSSLTSGPGFPALGTGHRALADRAADLNTGYSMQLVNARIRVISRCFPARTQGDLRPPARSAAYPTNPDSNFPKIRISILANYRAYFGKASLFYWVGLNNFQISLTGETKYLINNCT